VLQVRSAKDILEENLEKKDLLLKVELVFIIFRESGGGELVKLLLLWNFLGKPHCKVCRFKAYVSNKGMWI